MNPEANPSRLLIISNRLPVVVARDEHGDWEVESGSGGLVTALAPVLRHRGGVWIGWAGAPEIPEEELERLLAARSRPLGYTMKPVTLSDEDVEEFYYGFANEIVWPLFHDLPSRCNFEPAYWSGYRRVNEKFTRVILANREENDFIWVHDYHLFHVAEELRRSGVSGKIGFFLHIPFPPLDLFLKLPWRFQVLHALLAYDLLGFQTVRDRRNFLQCVRLLLSDVAVETRGSMVFLRRKGAEVRVGVFPISIDFAEFANQAASPEVAERAWYIHEHLPNTQILLGVDRLDYTKGIPERLRAFRDALRRYPELHERIVFMQVVVPSRARLKRYQDLKLDIERLVSQINGEFTRSGWVPIHYVFRPLERAELLAYYRTAEIAIVTPLKDGMNLVAKEYCAASLETGVLILSEFAGAAAQMQKSALLVNPNDITGMADAIYRAFTMDRAERMARMRRLRATVKRQDIYDWVNSFLSAAIARKLDNFPVLPDYLPQMEYEPHSNAD
ncbi:trehalose-6-phosphate synthase [bacterium]|nr:trehalose-6-phosphate synthase [bacterium]